MNKPLALLLGVAIATCCVPTAAAQEPGAPSIATPVEEIYVVRSLRQSRATPTPNCAEESAGFGGAIAEDQYALHSVATRPADGLVINASKKTVGRVLACVGPTADPLILNFYAEGAVGGVSFKGIGDCSRAKADHPEPGITFYSCFLKLRDLPQGYASGQLTSSTILSREPIGGESDPPGYVQSSIATIRLWRRR
jgi:hypothetical protein